MQRHGFLCACSDWVHRHVQQKRTAEVVFFRRCLLLAPLIHSPSYLHKVSKDRSTELRTVLLLISSMCCSPLFKGGHDAGAFTQVIWSAGDFWQPHVQPREVLPTLCAGWTQRSDPTEGPKRMSSSSTIWSYCENSTATWPSAAQVPSVHQGLKNLLGQWESAHIGRTHAVKTSCVTAVTKLVLTRMLLFSSSSSSSSSSPPPSSS